MWPEIYGSLSREGFDFIRSGSKEGNDLLQFLNSVKQPHPRYSSLPELDLLNGSSGVRNTLADFSTSSRRYSDSKIMDTDILLGDGWPLLPNQHISMIAVHHRFGMLARQLLQLPTAEQSAAQYLIEGSRRVHPLSCKVRQISRPSINMLRRRAATALSSTLNRFARPISQFFSRVSGQRAAISRRLSKRSTA